MAQRFDVMLTEYETYLSRLPLSQHTRRNYLLRVKRYIAWLSDTTDAECALNDSVGRSFSVQEFKTWLLRKGCSANTVNSFLAAIDNYFLFTGAGSTKVKRQELPKQSPRALDNDELRRFLRAVLSSKSIRNKTMAMVMLHCGLRISEVAGLNASDVVLTARKRELTVRCGKNSKRRVIPVNKDAAEVLQQYMIGRLSDPEAPLFESRPGGRISVQSIDHMVRRFGKDSGVEVSSHKLRHTFITRLIRAGCDVVTVAELAGHSRLETTRRYSLPSQDVMLAAVEKLNYAASQ
jgi:site-specific recombinase XerD